MKLNNYSLKFVLKLVVIFSCASDLIKHINATPTSCSNPHINSSILKALGRVLDYQWIVTSSNIESSLSSRHVLYEISLCEPSSLCSSSSSSSGAANVCKLVNQSSSIIGSISDYELKPLSNGYLLIMKSDTKCSNNLSYVTYIYFYCDKKLGLPVLVNDYNEQTDTDDEGSACKVVFKWNTNQVCKDGQFDSTNEVPCYLTLSDQAFDDYYMTVDFSHLMLTKSSSLNNLTNFYQVLELDSNIDISLDLCRYGNSSKLAFNCRFD